jgi:RNA polymerase sigma factor (TIGR02999 family)
VVVPTSDDITELLRAWSDGDQGALVRLIPIIYNELHRRAKNYMAQERTGHVLQTTALVNEAYLRLVGCQRVNWRDRAHFFAVSAELMRRILIDFARSGRYLKRGGGVRLVSLEEALGISRERGGNLVALDDALKALAAIDSRKARVVELRFFGGLTVEETAEVLKVSPETVTRDWKTAKVWLLRETTRQRRDGS